MQHIFVGVKEEDKVPLVWLNTAEGVADIIHQNCSTCNKSKEI